MQTNARNLKKLFQGDTRYVIPLFQRPYVWNRRDQWEPLWEDIRALAEAEIAGESSPHFMGAIVLNQSPQPTGEIDVRLVIDGQQRLTTIQLFLEAMRDIAQRDNHQKFDALDRLTRNPPDVCATVDDQFKIWPTNVDRSAFTQVMGASRPSELKGSKQIGGDSAIANAWLYFYDAISEWLSESPETSGEKFEALNAVVTQQLTLVVIDLEQDEDPQVIFETLNARMTPLLPADLVKNLLFRNVGNIDGEAAAETLYLNTWQAFDADHDFWRVETGRGHARRYRIDLFLQNYLTAVTAAEVPVAHLYSEFVANLKNRNLASREWLSEIAHYATGYETVVRCTGPYGDQLSALAKLNYDTVNPVVLQLIVQRTDDTDAVNQVLSDIESFLIRRMVCGLTTRGYGRFFLSLLPALATSDYADRTRTKLLEGTADASRWPNDDEFRRGWLSAPVYHFQKGRLTTILLAIEKALAGRHGERISLTGPMTVEHILPQQWEPHFPLSEDATSDHRDRRERLLHTFGNLTLVSGALNGSMNNGPWLDWPNGKAGKRSALKEHSQLNLNRRLLDDPRWLEQWNDEAIETRGRELFVTATRLWAHP